jgi:hypothetical protein
LSAAKPREGQCNERSQECRLFGLFLVFAAGSAMAQNGLTLTVGKLTFTGQYLKQVVSVKNETTNAIRLMKIECGFFHEGQLIAANSGYLENLAPGSSGFTEILTQSSVSADRAQCRIVEAP